MEKNIYKYLVIGAGITGVTIARLLQQRGEDNFIILESEKEAGGLCKTVEVNGHVLDTGGGHFLYTKHQEVYDFIFSHIPKSEFNYFDRVSKIRVEGCEVDYPLESNFWQLPLDLQVRYLIAAVQCGEVLGKKEPKNYEEWTRWKLGNIIAEHYMLPYNEKIWGVKPQQMDIDWLHKIPSLNTEEIVKNCLKHDMGTEKMPSHPGFYYPKEGGFQKIFDAIYDPVKDKVKLGEPVNKLVKNKNSWTVNDKYEAEIVINTVPWPYLYNALGQPKNLVDSFKKLIPNKLVVSLWEKEYDHNWHWVYEPNKDVEYHREFYVHNFAPHSKKTTMYTETNIKRWPGENDWVCAGENSKPVVEFINQAAYPVPVIGHADAIKTILDYYKKDKLYGVGRWGQWQYLNADACIMEAMDFVKKS